MKKLLCTIAALMITASAFGQGTVIFNNRLPALNGGDQNIYLGGTEQLRGDSLNSMGFPGPGAGYTAGLFLVGQDTPIVTAPFRSNASGSANFFITAPAAPVSITGRAPGTQAQLVIRAWQDTAGSWANAVANPAQFAHGESNPVTVTLGGEVPGSPATPAPYLEGLQEFNLFIVPEPSTIALGVLGAAALLLRRRK